MWNNFSSVIVVIVGLGFVTMIGGQSSDSRPNIMIIMADDMGFDDVSFRGNQQFLTPNIDALAYSGVILKHLYVPAMCTPSRAALLTGKYPTSTGMQHYVITNDQPWSLPTNETTMAEIFQSHGYYTSLIGKWHLGMSRQAYTPTRRGFDHYYGYLGAYIDYWDHTLHEEHKNFTRGHDFRNNLRPMHDRRGSYVTDVLTDEAVRLIQGHNNSSSQPLFLILSHLAPHSGNDDDPLQAPQDEIDRFAHIKDERRRTYAAMMSMLDKSVARVISALSERSMLSNTVLLFYSDNGGPTEGMHATTASNYPLRGQKNSPWEGAVRSSGAIWSPQLEKLGIVWRQRIYVADLLPTLASAAGIAIDPSLLSSLDGMNLWSALRYGYESLEREIVHNIDDVNPESSYYAYARGKWKLVQGSTVDGDYDGWLGRRPEGEVDPRAAKYEKLVRETSVWRELSVFNGRQDEVNITRLRQEAAVVCQFAQSEEVFEHDGLPDHGTPCNPLNETCLFDIDVDPCEQNNLFDQYKGSKFVQEMLTRVEHFRQLAHEPNNRPSDPKCDPKLYGGEWTWWEDELEGVNSGAGNAGGVWWGSHLTRVFINRISLLLAILG